MSKQLLRKAMCLLFAAGFMTASLCGCDEALLEELLSEEFAESESVSSQITSSKSTSSKSTSSKSTSSKSSSSKKSSSKTTSSKKSSSKTTSSKKSSSKTTSSKKSSSIASSAEEEGERFGPYEVVKVVDGDTIKLLIDGEKVNVRLIGIDTPESVHPDASKNVPEGKIASNHTKELVGSNDLYIEYGVEKQDHYGRPLCYVYLPDGTMLNEQILRDGYAKTLFVGKNNKYKQQFTEIQEEAREEGRGLWPSGVFDD